MVAQPKNITIHQTSTGFVYIPALLEHRGACLDGKPDMQAIALAAIEELRDFKPNLSLRDDRTYEIQIDGKVLPTVSETDMPDNVRQLFDWVMQYGAEIEAGKIADCDELTP
jgi:hypothetical protein